MKTKKGYTLTEVLVVVLIIGILGAIAYPVYTKTIMRSRAAEAVNLLELTRDKQMTTVSRSGKYFSDFATIDQLTANKSKETPAGRQMQVGKYTISLNDGAECLTVTYPNTKPEPAFSFSSAYDDSALGCTGAICATFAGIVGAAESVCNCGGQACGAGLDQDKLTCACSCNKLCQANGACFEPHTSAAATTRTEQTTHGQCTYECTSSTADCNGGTCNSWSSTTCTCDEKLKPAPIMECKNKSLTVWTYSCQGGTWTEAKEPQTITVDCCEGETKMITDSDNTKCGTRTGTATCQKNLWVNAWNEWQYKEVPPAEETCETEGVVTRKEYYCDTKTGMIADRIIIETKEKPAMTEACGPCNKGTRNTGWRWTAAGCRYLKGKPGACQNLPADICDPATDQNCDPATCQITCPEATSYMRPCSRSNLCGFEYQHPDYCDTTTSEWVYKAWDTSGCVIKPSVRDYSGCSGGQSRIRTVTCDVNTGVWNIGAWGTCYDPPTITGESATAQVYTKNCTPKYQPINGVNNSTWVCVYAGGS